MVLQGPAASARRNQQGSFTKMIQKQRLRKQSGIKHAAAPILGLSYGLSLGYHNKGLLYLMKFFRDYIMARRTPSNSELFKTLE